MVYDTYFLPKLPNTTDPILDYEVSLNCEFLNMEPLLKGKFKVGNTNWGGGLSTVDLLIKVACFVKKVNNIFKEKLADLN